MTHVTVIGNLAGPPELRFTPSGKAVANFNLAENHWKKNQQGEFEQTGTTWRRCAIWGDKAEALAEANLAKGTRVIVTGSEELRPWESREGKQGVSLELNVRDIGVAIMPPRQDQQGGYQQRPQQGNQRPQQGPPQGGYQPQNDPWNGQQGQINAGQWGNGDENPPF